MFLKYLIKILHFGRFQIKIQYMKEEFVEAEIVILLLL